MQNLPSQIFKKLIPIRLIFHQLKQFCSSNLFLGLNVNSHLRNTEMVCSDTSALPICYSSAPAIILKVIGVLASLLRSGNSVPVFPYKRLSFTFPLSAQNLFRNSRRTTSERFAHCGMTHTFTTLPVTGVYQNSPNMGPNRFLPNMNGFSPNPVQRL